MSRTTSEGPTSRIETYRQLSFFRTAVCSPTKWDPEYEAPLAICAELAMTVKQGAVPPQGLPGADAALRRESTTTSPPRASRPWPFTMHKTSSSSKMRDHAISSPPLANENGAPKFEICRRY